MIGRCLITSSIEETWPKDHPVLFLGEWCKLYSRKKHWSKLDAKVLSYHWYDRVKLKNDLFYLQHVREVLLNDLAKQLNKVHEVNHSNLYWDILIGVWLNTFIETIYDKWYSLKSAIESNHITSCIVIERDPVTMVPFDMHGFSILLGSNEWNEYLCSQLLINYFSNDVDLSMIQMDAAELKFHQKKPPPRNKYNKLKSILSYFISKVNSFTKRSDEYFFLSSYMPRIKEIQLQILLGQFPKLWKPIEFKDIGTKVNLKQRFWGDRLSYKNSKDEFLNILGTMIPLNIPKIYLEDYSRLVSSVKKLPWPESPKVIFTSVGQYHDDLFKAWTGEKKENGSSFVIGQHGGGYGVTDFNSLEDNEIDISDYFVSWGWSKKNKNIVPLGNFKEFFKELSYDPKGDALLVENYASQFTHRIIAFPVSGQWLNYFDDQFKFIKLLPKNINSRIMVRLSQQDRDWNAMERWNDCDFEVKFDPRAKPIKKLITKCRLYISTTNATTYLESLTWNVPTVIFWNPKHWELTEEAQLYFNILKDAKIYHETPESAAQHIEEVWDDIDQWWKSDQVQKARSHFCRKYTYTSKTMLNDMVEAFREYK
jgi:putative transferase (TIGR04331 family)